MPYSTMQTKQEYYTKISQLKLLKLQMMSSAEEYVIVFFL